MRRDPVRKDRVERALSHLRIPEGHLQLVALLPLVEVAWSDGVVQAEERRLILSVAEKHGLVGPADRAVVEEWLAEAPSGLWLDHARHLVSTLAKDLPEELGPTEVVAWCWALADAAGGLLGTRFRAVSKEEQAALQRIADALGVAEIRPEWRHRTV